MAKNLSIRLQPGETEFLAAEAQKSKLPIARWVRERLGLKPVPMRGRPRKAAFVKLALDEQARRLNEAFVEDLAKIRKERQ